MSGIDPGVDRQGSQQQECASPELSLVGATDTVQVIQLYSYKKKDFFIDFCFYS